MLNMIQFGLVIVYFALSFIYLLACFCLAAKSSPTPVKPVLPVKPGGQGPHLKPIIIIIIIIIIIRART